MKFGRRSPRVGFDRYIDLEWANKALEIYISDGPTQEKYDLLKNFIEPRIQGVEAAKKTISNLSTLWLNNSINDDEQLLLKRMMKSSLEDRDLAFLHHGKALEIYPFYTFVSKSIGKLCAIQSRFTKKELHSRVLEKYGDLSSVGRSIDRVLQSQVNWGLLEQEGHSFRIISKELFIAEGAEWLLESLLKSVPNRREVIQDLVVLPELLGYKLYKKDLQNAKNILIERDGANREIAYL